MISVGVSLSFGAVFGGGGAGSSGPFAPGSFTAAQWTLIGGNSKATVTVSALPATGGSAITAIQYRLNNGAWTAFSPALSDTGARDITGLTNGSDYTVEIRAVNTVGPGGPTTAKTIHLDDDVTAYIAAMTTKPSADQQAVIQRVFDQLKAKGIWAKLDHLYLVTNAPAEQSANVNAKNPAQSAVPTGGPTWTSVGYKMTAASSHVQFPVNLSNGGQFGRDSGHVGVWVVNQGNSSTSIYTLCGLTGYGGTGATLMQLGTGSSGDARLNSNAVWTPGAIASRKAGFVFSRTTSAIVTLYIDGAQFAQKTDATSETPRAVPYCIGRSASVYNDDDTFGAYSSGAGLTAQEAADLDAIMVEYLGGVSATPMTNVVNTDNTAIWAGDAPVRNTVNTNNTAVWE